jgi:peptidoglycan hydrolase-like protein with peptidoglycan-binding domain
MRTLRRRSAVRPPVPRIGARAAVVCGALALTSALPSAAAAAGTPSPEPKVPAPATPAPSPSTPAPAAGKIQLVLQKVGSGVDGKAFVLAGRRFVVRGIVVPYVAGQTVKVSFYREGRKVGVHTVSVLPVGNGAGQFHLGFTSHYAGVVQVRAAHYATPQQAAFSARSRALPVVNANLGPGASGPSVRVLQSELAALHYVVPLNGVFDEATGRALIAYRKMTNIARIAYAGSEVFARLAHGIGGFTVRYRHDGRHVEANLTKQVLAEIEPGGRVHAIYTMSSGKPSTPTVIGRFQVYSKTPGTNSEGMVDSNYFIRGYAIHGYAEVPTYAASHGCLRVPIPNAASIYAWVQYGTPVDVYNEGGGGSSQVRGNAGP